MFVLTIPIECLYAVARYSFYHYTGIRPVNPVTQANAKALKIVQDHLRDKYEKSYYDLPELASDLGLEPTPPSEATKKANERVICDLSQYIANFKQITRLTPASLRALSSAVDEDWKQVRQGFHMLGNFGLHPADWNEDISDIELDSIFFQGPVVSGFCWGETLSYFKQFHTTGDMLSSFFLPLQPADVETKKGVKFFVLDEEKIDKSQLEKKTKRARFLQAAFQLADRFKPTQSLEFIPNQIMKRQGCKIKERFPRNCQRGYSIEGELFSRLKEIIRQKKPDHYYAFLIHSSYGAHAIGLHLRPPFHFMDMKYGIVSADTVEDLVLVLSTFLAEKYRDFDLFAVFEVGFPALNRKTAQAKRG